MVGRPAPPGVKPDIPFRVMRSRFGNLPVYLDYKSGGNRVLTLVCKIEGDIRVREKEPVSEPSTCSPIHSMQVLEKLLRAHLGEKRLLTKVDGLKRTVILHGDYKDRAVAWLKTMGF